MTKSHKRTCDSNLQDDETYFWSALFATVGFAGPIFRHIAAVLAPAMSSQYEYVLPELGPWEYDKEGEYWTAPDPYNGGATNICYLSIYLTCTLSMQNLIIDVFQP